MIIVSFRHVIVKFFLTSLRSFSKWQVESFDTATRATKAQFCAKHNASPQIENHRNRARVCGASATGRTQDHGAKFRIKSVGIISECDTLCRDGAVSAIDTPPMADIAEALSRPVVAFQRDVVVKQATAQTLRSRRGTQQTTDPLKLW